MKVSACAVPPQSRLHARLAGAHFHDAYRVDNPHPGRPALALWMQTLGRTPGWVDAAMRARNAIVKRLGLKDLGVLRIDPNRPLQDYRVGERVGIFTALHLGEDEVVMGDDDKHLDVQVSLLKTADRQVVVSTVVHIHNALGRAYMLFVKPAHRVIAPAVLARFSERRVGRA
jgi:hypothetical protein